MMEMVLINGGIEPHEPRKYGFIFQRFLEDAEHTEGIFLMDKSQLPAAVS